jgi:hypothetical protein
MSPRIREKTHRQAEHSGRALLGATLVFTVSALAWTPLLAQPTPTATVREGEISSSTVLPLPPTPPSGKCPVDFFRELLAMSPAQRKQALANRPLVNQKLLLAKVHEYEALSKDQLELRLTATELRWYLVPLLSGTSTNREAQLAAIPEKVRQLVADRLQVWDRLPREVSQRLLNPAANCFAQEGARMLMPPPLPPVPPDRKVVLEQGIRQWQELSFRQRDEFANRFERMLDFTEPEKARILNVLSEGDRRQIEQTLEKFRQLPPPQRAICIKNFEKFASLTIQERNEFLTKAERWKLMTPTQRETWKDLVNRLNLQPPLPPGMTPPGQPPMPPGAASASAADRTLVGTNH